MSSPSPGGTGPPHPNPNNPGTTKPQPAVQPQNAGTSKPPSAPSQKTPVPAAQQQNASTSKQLPPTAPHQNSAPVAHQQIPITSKQGPAFEHPTHHTHSIAPSKGILVPWVKPDTKQVVVKSIVKKTKPGTAAVRQTNDETARAYLKELEEMYSHSNPNGPRIIKKKSVRVRRHPKAPHASPRRAVKPSKAVKLAELSPSSSSDDEYTHIPLSDLREYVFNFGDSQSQASKKAPTTGLESEYVDVPVGDGMEIIPDPKEPSTVKSCVEVTTLRLYVFWVILIVMASLLAAASLYMFIFIKKVYVQYILVELFWNSDYVNLLGVIICSMLTANVGIFFLCYPDPADWKCLKNARWILIIIPQIMMIIAHLDHVRILYNLPKIEARLERRMSMDLDFTRDASILILHSQVYFHCCGVHGCEDWRDKAGFDHFGYPQTCCNGEYFMGCEIPMTSRSLVIKIPQLTAVEVTQKPALQINEEGCLQYELKLLRGMIGLVVLLTILMASSSIIATVIMWRVISRTNQHLITTAHPFME